MAYLGATKNEKGSPILYAEPRRLRRRTKLRSLLAQRRHFRTSGQDSLSSGSEAYKFTGKPVSQVAIRPTGTSNLDPAKRQVEQEAIPEAYVHTHVPDPRFPVPESRLFLFRPKNKKWREPTRNLRRIGLRCEETRLSEKRIRIGTVQHSKFI